jgi:hypothetical protein
VSSSRSLSGSPHQLWPRGADPDVVLRQRLGPALLHWWEPRAELVTKSGSNVTDIVALNGTNFAGGTGALTLNTGGPGGRPFIAIGAATAYIEALSVWSTGRVACYSVMKFSSPSGAVDETAFGTFASTGATPRRHHVSRLAAGQYQGAMRFTTGVVGVVAGVADANWHAWSLRPLATGASWKKDGVEMSPTFAQSDTMQSGGATTIGSADGVSSGGGWAFGMLVDLATDPIVRDQAVADYVFQRFGMPI